MIQRKFFFVKLLKSENNKLSLLAYSILNETGEGVCNDRNYGLDWDNINTRIKEKNYKYELSQSELKNNGICCNKIFSEVSFVCIGA